MTGNCPFSAAPSDPSGAAESDPSPASADSRLEVRAPSAAPVRARLRALAGFSVVALLLTVALLLPGSRSVASSPVRIGVLLPLTGKFAAPGLAVRKGMELYQKISAEEGNAPLELVFRDTQEDARKTTAAMQELVEKQNVAAFLGPLVSSTVDDAARMAATLKRPMIVLSQRPEIPGLGDYVFRNFLTSQQQMQALALHAVNTLGLKRFVIVHPEQRYGMELASLFWDSVLELGGQIVGVESYAPGTTDFVNLSRKVGGKYYVKELRRKEFFKGEKEYLEAWKEKGKKPPKPYELPPIVDFDAVFIPDQHKAGSLVASTLAFQDIPIGKFTIQRDQSPVVVLGISTWNRPDLPLQGGDYVEHCAFVDTFFGGSLDRSVSAFVTRYQDHYHQTPDALAATGYDSVGLLDAALRQVSLKNTALRDAIAGLEGYEGATGKLAFEKTGELKRPPYVISVQDRKLIQVAPEPETPAEVEYTLPSPPPSSQTPAGRTGQK